MVCQTFRPSCEAASSAASLRLPRLEAVEHLSGSPPERVARFAIGCPPLPSLHTQLGVVGVLKDLLHNHFPYNLLRDNVTERRECVFNVTLEIPYNRSLIHPLSDH